MFVLSLQHKGQPDPTGSRQRVGGRLLRVGRGGGGPGTGRAAQRYGGRQREGLAARRGRGALASHAGLTRQEEDSNCTVPVRYRYPSGLKNNKCMLLKSFETAIAMSAGST